MEVAETACWDMAEIWFGKYLMMTLPIVLLLICFMIIESAETNKQIDYIEYNQLSDLSLSLSIRDLWRVHLDFVTNSTSTLFGAAAGFKFTDERPFPTPSKSHRIF
jgi:hypothetical protein